MVKKVEAPDQPRSWAIALAACTINSLLSGISRTTGLFYMALIDTYGVSRLQANLPFTVRNVVRNVCGPLVGAIGQRYGPRDVTIIGGIFASLGILACTFASDVIWVTILWGGVHGFGVALGNTLFQVVVTQYFLKYRATASGLALSGACVGSFVFPVLLEYMLENLGLSGTFLVTGGLIMHVLPASIMLKEPPWVRRQKTVVIEPPPLKRVTSKPVMIMTTIKEDPSAPDVLKNVRDFVKASPLGSVDVKEEEKQSDSPSSSKKEVTGVDNPALSVSKTDLSGIAVNKIQDEIMYEGRLRGLSLGGTSLSIRISPEEELQETSLRKGIFKVCRDPMFHMISLSMAAFAMLFDPTITVIVDYITDKGMKEDVAKYFISMMSLGDLVGRLCFGWVTDRNFMSIPHFMLLLQVVQGICFLLMPFISEFNTLMAVVVIYGLLSGANLVMFPILVGKYLQSVQSLAIGCVNFISGIFSFAVPPIIGYFRDEVGSYDGMFFITGGLSVAVGFLWIMEPLFLKLRTKLENRNALKARTISS